VSYRYAGTQRHQLVECDLELRPGTVVGVTGANDSGKSTLALVASGLAPTTIGGDLTGRVLIDGLDTRSARPHELAQRCAVLFQNPQTQLSGVARTVFEEVAFGPRNLGLPVDEIVQRVVGALDVVGATSLQARDPQRLSGGQEQLVALASVIALRPAYLVLDEPTSQLDPLGSRLISEALRHIAERDGTGLLVIEHKTDLLEEWCDEVLVLRSGRVVLSGTPTAVFDDPDLRTYGVEPPAGARLRALLQEAGLPAGLLASP
jgi:energy-coupling factor transporter ATP-binding protein EcfA2